MYLNTQIDNLILFALAFSALLITSCSDRYEAIPDPNYPPQLLHLGNPIKTNRKQIPSHLITAPDTLPYRELYIGPAELKYTAEKTDYQPAGEPGFTLSQAKRVDMDSVAPPLYRTFRTPLSKNQE